MAGSSVKKPRKRPNKKPLPTKPSNPLSFDNPPPDPIVKFTDVYHVNNPHLPAELPLPDTLLSTAFRTVRDPTGRPNWRYYMKYVEQAARNGDEDMVKFLGVFATLPKKEQRTVMPETLCDLSGVQPHELVGAVSAELWRSKALESSMLAAFAHPVVMGSIAENAQHPLGGRDRELFMRTTGSLPDKKGTSIVVNNNQQSAILPGSVGPTSGFMSMDQDVIEMGKALEAPDGDTPTFFKDV